MEYRNKCHKNGDKTENNIHGYKQFCFYDGSYTLVPDIADYGMWDGRNNEFLIEKMVENNSESPPLYSRLLSRAEPHLDVRFYVELKDYADKNRCMLARRVGESFTTESFFVQKPTSYVFSGDGKWLILSFSGIDSAIAFIPVDQLEENATLLFHNPIVSVAISHYSSLCVVAESNKAFFIIPNKYQKSIKNIFNIKRVEFSVNDRYLVIYGERNLLLYQINVPQMEIKLLNCRAVNFNSDIAKVFISPDSQTIVISFKDGELLFWQDFYNSMPINKHNAGGKLRILKASIILLWCGIVIVLYCFPLVHVRI